MNEWMNEHMIITFSGVCGYREMRLEEQQECHHRRNSEPYSSDFIHKAVILSKFKNEDPHWVRRKKSSQKLP